MSLSILRLLPSLYNVQKILQDNAVAYGPLIYIDPINNTYAGSASSTSSPLPSKGKNIDSITSIADNLVQCSTMMNGINSSRKQMIKNADLFTWIVATVLIIGIAFGVFVIALFFGKDGQFGGGKLIRTIKQKISNMGHLHLMGVVLAVIILGMFLHVDLNLGQYKNDINNALNDPSPIQTYNIGKTMSMFNVTGSSQTEIELLSNNPAMVWYWSQMHPNTYVNWENDMYCQSIDVIEEEDITPNSDNTFLNTCNNKTETDKDYFKYMYPFISKTAPDIDPFLLKKEIQSFDLYGQLSRIQESVAYFNQLLLRKNDEVYGGSTPIFTPDQIKALRNKVGDIILEGGVGVGVGVTRTNVTSESIATTNTVVVASPPPSLASLLSRNRNQVVGSIIDAIVTDNPTESFNMSNDDVTFIASYVSSRIDQTEFGIISGPLNDILTEIPVSLQKTRNLIDKIDPSKDYMKKYIPVDRYIAKVGAMTSTQFVTNLAFYTEEMRSASAGIHNLNQQYNIMDIKLEAYEEMSSAIKIWMLLIFLLVWIMIVYYLVNNGEKKDYVFYTSKLLYIVVISGGIIILYAMLNSYLVKKNALKQYNYQLMVSNGQEVVSSSHDMMSLLQSDMAGNMYGIKIQSTVTPPSGGIPSASVSTTTDSASTIYITDNITLDPYNTSAANGNDVSNDNLFQNIVQNTKMSNNIVLNLNANNNLNEIYNKSISALEAYNKCNSLFSLNDTTIQFPIVEVASYGIIILVIFAIIGMTLTQYSPVEIYEKFVWFKKVRRNTSIAQDADADLFKVMETKKAIAEEQARSEQLHIPLAHNAFTMASTRVAGCIIILFVVIICTMTINDNANGYVSGLYGNIFGGGNCKNN